ncbi:MAG: tetratricopeptide repeat protein [Nitrospinae bacterium]|nr:tetratricopeptide repeat protein [Nitrospinota bacterium]
MNSDSSNDNNAASSESETASQKLPVRQKLIAVYKAKLRDLVKKHSHLPFSLDDKTLSANLANVLERVGFHTYPQPAQQTGALIANIVKWLKSDYLILLHYRPQTGGHNLVNLLRAIKSSAPNTSFKTLIPVFFLSYSSQKQQDIFRLLGNFGIRYASFLTTNAEIDTNIEEILKDLLSFHKMMTAAATPEKKDPIALKDGDMEKVNKYKELLTRGEELFQKGEYEEAIKVFTEAISIHANFQALVERGDAYYKSKKFMPALSDYREANKLEQSVPSPYAKIAACCFVLIKENKDNPEKIKTLFALAMKHLKEAESLIDKMARDNAGSPERLPKSPYAPVVAALGEADFREMGLEDFEREISKLSARVIKNTSSIDYVDPDLEMDIRIDQAILLARNQEYEKAEKIFRQVIDEDPSFVGPAFNNYAVELRKNGHEGKAFQIYMELLGHEIPDRNIVVENLKTAGLNHAVYLREHGRQEEAYHVYKDILKFNPRGKEWVLCDLAMAYLETQNQAQASFRLMEAIYINPRIMAAERFDRYRDLRNLREEMIKKLNECAS